MPYIFVEYKKIIFTFFRNKNHIKAFFIFLEGSRVGMEWATDLEMYREALRAERIGVARWDIKLDRVFGDSTMMVLYPDHLTNGPYSEFLLCRPDLHPNDVKFFDALVRFVQAPHHEYADKAHEIVVEYRLTDAGNHEQWFHAHFTIHFEKEWPRSAILLLRSTDSEHKSEETLRQKAERDALTGLYNKGHARELIDEALAVPGTTKALLVLDMDGFKKVNDNLGHLFGDAVISDMALSLAEVFSSDGDIIGRVGGDEFVVLLRDIESRDAVVASCEKLRDMLRRSFEYGKNQTLNVSGSVGIALSPEFGASFETLFSCADKALYEAKRRGRDTQVFYTDELREGEKKNAGENAIDEGRQALLDHPVEFIFRMLYETRNPRITVETLLALFAKYFMVQRVVIYQNQGENPGCWFEWRADGTIPTADAHDGAVGEFLNRTYRKEIHGHFLEFSDTSKINGPMGTLLPERSIFALLYVNVMDGDKRIGCVGFEDCRGTRIWTKREHEILRTFADILGTFLMDQMRYKMVRRGYRRLQGVLDAVAGRIWVVATEDGHIAYMNRATRAMLAESENAETKNCYKVRTDTNRPCARCEYAELQANCPGARPLREEAERLGLVPIPIRWDKGLDGQLYLLDT